MPLGQLEDGATLRGFRRIIEIDPVDDANEPSRPGCPRKRAHHVTEEPDSLRLVQLGGTDFLLAAAHGDRRAAGRAQVADPVDLAPRRPDPAPTLDVDDRHRRRARLAARPAGDGDEPVEAQRHAGSQEELGDRPEERDPPWGAGGAVRSEWS